MIRGGGPAFGATIPDEGNWNRSNQRPEGVSTGGPDLCKRAEASILNEAALFSSLPDTNANVNTFDAPPPKHTPVCGMPLICASCFELLLLRRGELLFTSSLGGSE